MSKLLYTVFFKMGSDEVSEQAIKESVEAIRANPGTITVIGSACDTPIVKPETKNKFENNLVLSSYRALNVVRGLVKAGISESQITGKYIGAQMSADKDSKRVVEIHLN